MTEIKTLGHTIIVVPVPEESGFFNIHGSVLTFDPDITTHDGNFYHAKLPSESLEILGFCTPSEISFDVKEFVQKTGGITDRSRGGAWYLDYAVKDEKSFTFEFPEQSFRSLLAANGVLFENGKEPLRTDFNMEDKTFDGEFNEFISQHKKWKEAQNSVIKKCVILLKK